MLSDEEKQAIEKQFSKGLVNVSSLIEPLVNSYKQDKTSIDIQQCQFIIDYLILDRDYLELYIEDLESQTEKQKNIIDSTKRILYDEELDYCDTLDEIYHFYEEVVNNVR